MLEPSSSRGIWYWWKTVWGCQGQEFFYLNDEWIDKIVLLQLHEKDLETNLMDKWHFKRTHLLSLRCTRKYPLQGWILVVLSHTTGKAYFHKRRMQNIPNLTCKPHSYQRCFYFALPNNFSRMPNKFYMHTDQLST